MKYEFVRDPYNYDSDELSDETGLLCEDESLTEQEHVEEADINYIADRFMRTGEMRQILDLPTSGDFDGIFDYQTAMNNIVQAKSEFMKLPARTRSRFDNDPAKILEFVENPDNYDEAVSLGFIPKKEKENVTETGRTAEATTKKQEGNTGTTGNPQDAKATEGTR